MKEALAIVLVSIVLIASAIAIDNWRHPVHAAEANGCDVVGVVGSVIVARCIDDETGLIVFANSAGFMVIEP